MYKCIYASIYIYVVLYIYVCVLYYIYMLYYIYIYIYIYMCYIYICIRVCVCVINMYITQVNKSSLVIVGGWLPIRKKKASLGKVNHTTSSKKGMDTSGPPELRCYLSSWIQEKSWINLVTKTISSMSTQQNPSCISYFLLPPMMVPSPFPVVWCHVQTTSESSWTRREKWMVTPGRIPALVSYSLVCLCIHI